MIINFFIKIILSDLENLKLFKNIINNISEKKIKFYIDVIFINYDELIKLLPEYISKKKILKE